VDVSSFTESQFQKTFVPIRSRLDKLIPFGYKAAFSLLIFKNDYGVTRLQRI